MADLSAKPKRVTRVTKRTTVAVPFMPDVPVAAEKPLPELIEEIAHLPIDPPTTAVKPDQPAGLDRINVTPAEVEEPTKVEAQVQPEASAEAEASAVLASPTQSHPHQTTAATTAPNVQEDHSMTDTMQNTAETMQANTQDAISKGKQAFEDMTAFGQGNVEAMVESTRVAVKGVEAMAQARAAFAKQSFEATVQTLKSMSEVRTPTDFFKLQGEYLRNSMDALVAETSRSTEATLKLVGEIAQPIQNRVAIAAEKVRTVA